MKTSTHTSSHQPHHVHAALLVALVSGLALTSACAAAPKVATPPQNQAAGMVKTDHHGEAMAPMMAKHVETRIKTLHAKLGITSAQEAKWGDVAQTMRDNEAAIARLIETRHQNLQSMTAIDDLQSYAVITQEHADGMKKLVAVFQPLYADMSDEQKKKADDVFGRFEGHRGDSSAKKHSK